MSGEDRIFFFFFKAPSIVEDYKVGVRNYPSFTQGTRGVMFSCLGRQQLKMGNNVLGSR